MPMTERWRQRWRAVTRTTHNAQLRATELVAPPPPRCPIRNGVHAGVHRGAAPEPTGGLPGVGPQERAVALI